MKPLRRIKPLIGWRDDLGAQPPAGLVGTISPYLRGDCSGLVGDCTALAGNCTGLTGNILDHVQEEGE